MKKRYECPGSCGGTVEVDDWQDEAPTCSEDGCEHHDQPLEKRMFCERCETSYAPDETHNCPADYIR